MSVILRAFWQTQWQKRFLYRIKKLALTLNFDATTMPMFSFLGRWVVLCVCPATIIGGDKVWLESGVRN